MLMLWPKIPEGSDVTSADLLGETSNVQINLSSGVNILLELQISDRAVQRVIFKSTEMEMKISLKEKLGFDYTIANELSLENDKISGEIKMPLGWGKAEEQCLKHSVCKLNALIYLSQKTGIPLGRCVAIGDNLSDVCMLKKAGLGIAFNPKHSRVEKAADIVVTEDLSRILPII